MKGTESGWKGSNKGGGTPKGVAKPRKGSMASTAGVSKKSDKAWLNGRVVLRACEAFLRERETGRFQNPNFKIQTR